MTVQVTLFTPAGKLPDVTTQELLKLLLSVSGFPSGVAPSVQLEVQLVDSPKFSRVPLLDPDSLASVVSPAFEQQDIPLLNL